MRGSRVKRLNLFYELLYGEKPRKALWTRKEAGWEVQPSIRRIWRKLQTGLPLASMAQLREALKERAERSLSPSAALAAPSL